MRCREMHGAVMVEVRCEERELKPTINVRGWVSLSQTSG